MIYEKRNIKEVIGIIGIVFSIIMLTILSYHETFKWLYGRFTAVDTYYSHGFLIPVISIYFIYKSWDDIKSLPVERSLIGLYILIGSLCLNIVGVLIHFFFISGISLYFYFIGIVLFIFGPKITRRILFPLLFLIFMIPLPVKLIGAILYPMKILVLNASVYFIRAFSIPVYVEGFNVQIASGTLEIGNPCSGLRSLISYLAMGAIVGYLFTGNRKSMAAVILSSIPIAFMINILRTIFLIMVGLFFGIEYSAPDYWLHDASGVALFAVGFAILIYLVRIAKWQKQ